MAATLSSSTECRDAQGSAPLLQNRVFCTPVPDVQYCHNHAGRTPSSSLSLTNAASRARKHQSNARTCNNRRVLATALAPEVRACRTESLGSTALGVAQVATAKPGKVAEKSTDLDCMEVGHTGGHLPMGKSFAGSCAERHAGSELFFLQGLP